MSTVPADAAARHAIAHDHDRTIFVEAGAGSGKTSALVSRVVSLVLGGTDVRAVAAITFTEAAAAELRARVRQALETLEAGGRVRGVSEVVGAEVDVAGRAREALDGLDGATICTLHAFAQRLLLAAPVECGLPPRVEIHDQVSSRLRSDERWQVFEARLLEDESLADVLRAALVLGIDTGSLRGVATVLGENWDLVEEADRAGIVERRRSQDVDLTVPVDDWIGRLEALEARAGEALDPSSELVTWLREQAGGLARSLRANRGEPFTVLSLLGWAPPSPSKGRQEQWPDGVKKDVVAQAKAVIADVQATRARIVDAVLDRLGGELARYTLRDAEVRRRDGTLEFHDLLVLARRLLRNEPDVRRRLGARYEHLLIDEFQDTDPLQIEIAVRLAADGDVAADAEWSEIPVPDGALFFVGDPKQSIYRFRRADIDLFARTSARHADGRTSLHVNFRTVAPILDLCNAVFARMIGDGEPRRDGRGRIVQPTYTPLTAHRTAIPDDPGPAVRVLEGPEHPTVGAAKEAEARDVAATLAEAKATGWLVQPDPSAEPRACEWSDMAVLLPSRATLGVLRDALDAQGVPYRIESGTLVYGTTEVDDLRAVLRAIDDPGDAIALVGALRSPLYGCGDDDLKRWVDAGHRLAYLGQDHALAPPEGTEPAVPVVAAALVDLRDRHRRAPHRSVPEIVADVLRGRRAMEIAQVAGGHSEVRRLHRVVLEHARAFADSEPGGLRDFLRWVELQADDRVTAASPVLPEADVQAVRILTIHGAKGLEFGITAVSGLSGQDPAGRTGPVVLFEDDHDFQVRMRKGMETTRFEAARTLEETMDLEERIRLLYVGLTRARDHLVVSCHRKARTSNCHAARLAAALEEVDQPGVERWTCPDAFGAGVRTPPADEQLDEHPEPVVVPDPPSTERVATWQEATARWREARRSVLTGADRVTSVTGLLRDARSEGEVEPEPIEPTEQPWRRGRGGTALGSAVHAVLQHAPLDAVDDAAVADLARWQAGVEGVPELAEAVAARALAGLRSPLVRRAAQARRWRRELHVAVPTARLDLGSRPVRPDAPDLLEGFVDLCFEDHDGRLVVIDHKTDGVRGPAEVASALDRHAPQGALYALLLEAVTGREVSEVHFLFLGEHGAVDAPVSDLAARRAGIVDLLTLPSGGAP